MYNETEDGGDHDGGFNDRCDDENEDEVDVEIENDDNDHHYDDDGGDDEGNFVNGVTADGDVSNIENLIGETR